MLRVYSAFRADRRASRHTIHVQADFHSETLRKRHDDGEAGEGEIVDRRRRIRWKKDVQSSKE